MRRRRRRTKSKKRGKNTEFTRTNLPLATLASCKLCIGATVLRCYGTVRVHCTRAFGSPGGCSDQLRSSCGGSLSTRVRIPYGKVAISSSSHTHTLVVLSSCVSQKSWTSRFASCWLCCVKLCVARGVAATSLACGHRRLIDLKVCVLQVS